MRVFIIAFLVILLEINLAPSSKIIDICNPSKKTIYAAVGSSNIISTWEIHSKSNEFSKCHVEIVACPACVITLKVWLLDLSKTNENENFVENSCNGDRLEITEPLHKAHTKRQFCRIKNGNQIISIFFFRSQTNGINISLFYKNNYEHPFTVEYTVKHNIRNLEIDVDKKLDTLEGTLSSPFFPIQYPIDYRVQYNIKCLTKIENNCRIKLIFTDYQLGPQSLLEFFESKTQRIGITTGRIFRPPVIISRGPQLSINFFANRVSSFGFKANYTVILGNEDVATLKPKTTCGGYIQNNGGIIIMSKIVPQFNTTAFDCVWILRPLLGYKHFKTHLSVKIISFDNLEYNSELQVHKGPTSGHKKLQHIQVDNQPNCSDIYQEHVESINTGFYIHFKGIFNSRSRVAISYATFSYSHSHDLEDQTQIAVLTQDCYMATDFLCYNHRCIPGHLHCDGFDHCGDNSDELYQCTREEDSNERWYHQNYYFPSLESFSTIPAGFVIAFFTSFTTFLLCSLICTLIHRTQHQSNLNNTLGTLTQVLAEQRSRTSLPENVNEEPPPQYESPPNYQDVMEMEILLCNHKKRLSKNTHRIKNIRYEHPLLEEFHDVETASASCSEWYKKPKNESTDDDSYNGDGILLSPYCDHENTFLNTENPVLKKKTHSIAITKSTNLSSKSTSIPIFENSNVSHSFRKSKSEDGLISVLESKRSMNILSQ